MTTPSPFIYVRPGAASYAWNYAGVSLPSTASALPAAVTAVAFDASSALGQAATRGDLQYSADNGRTWTGYTLPVDGQGDWVGTAATLWRFHDRLAGDSVTPDSFTVHYRLADGSVASMEETVIADTQPVGLVGQNDLVFSTMKAGAVVDQLAPIDIGATTGGRWVIEGQSTPGLFAIAYDPASDTSARLVIGDASRIPDSGMAAAVTVHYYDRYQVDAGGNPLPNTGVSRTLTYTVEDGASHDLPGFADEVRLGAGSSADATHGGAAPALATLAGGGLVAVWQAPDTAAGGAGYGLWAQLRDAAGNARGSAFALTLDGNAAIEGAPAVAALGDGRFAVAYTLEQGGAARIAWRVVDAGGSVGVEHVVDSGGAPDAAMPTIAALADGSLAIGWRGNGAVHVHQSGVDGVQIGSDQTIAVLGSAYDPSLTALKGGGWALAWGEIGDGNVYASVNGNAPFVASGDGYAASITTAAPLAHVAALADGGFVVAWDSYANDPHGFSISDIYFQRFDGAGHVLGALTQANVESGGGRYDAAVAALSDGGFVVTWEGPDGDANGIFGRRFGADGGARDVHEFSVSQERAGDQSTPDVTALAGGGFATAWVDTSAAGTGVEARVLAGDAGATAPVQAATQAGSSGNASPAPVWVPAATAVPAAPVYAPAGAAPVGAAGPSAASALLASVTGSGGDDALAAPSGNSRVDGGAGLDKVAFGGADAGYVIAANGADFVVNDAYGNHATLVNVERVQFADQMVALDLGGAGGQAYRLYQAAFDRTPDKVGLGYWIAALDHGHTLTEVADSFIGSAEFGALYGAAPDDAQFVQALYQNVLHRAPEEAGYAFWMQSLHSVSRAVVLADFSESAENQAQVIGSIQNGIHYVDWS
ncbi:DUF4214 domain-containing protein [Massilia forsythiae]|uniref:DUF4214 domain-containing protein n=1 Tax=Massilia forsythiae TaxID=2728020 RepID=A0A7Z2ZR29_9BURK|nr:DUF4214 domain-containing protein [Massilia forsythiae]QJD98733.1 DUF4214 domain-containing protein [Massilia forsythiae]